MKYYFFIGYYNNYIDANCRIAINIAKQLIEQGRNCSLFLYSGVITDITTIEVDGITLRVLPINKKNVSTKKQFLESNCNKILFFIKHPILTIKYLFHSKDDYKEILRVYGNNKDDIFLYFVAPSDSTYKLIKKGDNINTFLYQLDPWGHHEFYSGFKRSIERFKELVVYKKCRFIFTTDQLFKTYKNDRDYKRHITKMIPIKFPNLIKKIEKKQFDNKTINIIYLGRIDDEYRNPSYIVESLIKIVKKYNLKIKVFFIGKMNSKVLFNYHKKYAFIMINNNGVSFEEANSIMNSDNIFLLNINNTIRNQMPSKLIDYISTGNPIINVVKHDDDYSLEVLRKYDNKINIIENKGNIEELYHFLQNNINKRILFDEIVKKYEAYTPDHVSRIIDKIAFR